MRKFSFVMLILVAAFTLTSCAFVIKQTEPTEKFVFETESEKPTEMDTAKESASEAEQTTAADTASSDEVAPGYQRSDDVSEYVDIRMDSGKHMVVKLRPDVAPLTVENFQKLVSEGFYNGLFFHRIIPGFMIQGGDPDGTGTGGSDQAIKGEFAENGVDNSLTHKAGVLSMARSEDKDSASSQFFICHADSPHLDGLYAAFGELVLGAEVVDEIAALPRDAFDFPDEPPVMSEVFFVTPEE